MGFFILRNAGIIINDSQGFCTLSATEFKTMKITNADNRMITII